MITLDFLYGGGAKYQPGVYLYRRNCVITDHVVLIQPSNEMHLNNYNLQAHIFLSIIVLK